MRARSLCTMSNCRKSVLFVWAVSLLLACPIIWVMEEESIIYINADRTVRVVAHYCRDMDSIIFPTYRLLVLFCIPGLLMIGFYTAVIRELWLSTKNISVLTSNSRSTSEQSCLVKSESCQMNSSTSNNSFDHVSTEENRTRIDLLKSKCSSSMSRLEAERFQSCGGVYSVRLQENFHFEEPQTSARTSVRFQVPLATPKKKMRDKGDDVKKTRKQVIKMLIVIVLLFVLCWGPTIVIEMLIGLGQQTFNQQFYVFKWVSSLLPFVHCCINPVIYCFMSKNFRSSMAKALSYPCRSCRRRCYKGRSQRACSPNFFVRDLHSNRDSATLAAELPTLQTDLDVDTKI